MNPTRYGPARRIGLGAPPPPGRGGRGGHPHRPSVVAPSKNLRPASDVAGTRPNQSRAMPPRVPVLLPPPGSAAGRTVPKAEAQRGPALSVSPSPTPRIRLVAGSALPPPPPPNGLGSLRRGWPSRYVAPSIFQRTTIVAPPQQPTLPPSATVASDDPSPSRRSGEEVASLPWLGDAIFLDLDETLLFTAPVPVAAPDGTTPSKWPALSAETTAMTSPTTTKTSNRHHDYVFQGMRGFFRPHAVEFIRFCRRRFRLLFVYTASLPVYAKQLIEWLFHQRAQVRIDGLFDRSHCGSGMQKALRGLPLSPQHSQDICWNDVVFVDDTSTHVANNAAHGVLVPKFRGEVGDDWLIRLQRFLECKPAGSRWSDVERHLWIVR